MRLKKVSIAIVLCAMMLVSILGTTVNATIEDERVAACCDRMSTYTYTELEYKSDSTCYSMHGPCRIRHYNNYKVKKCQSCGAIHSRTYVTMTTRHSSEE